MTASTPSHCPSLTRFMARPLTRINLSSNGNAQFTTMDTAFTNVCLPWLTHDYTIFPYFDDLDMDAGGAFGIYFHLGHVVLRPTASSTSSGAPVISPNTGTANLELRLYEGQSRFDVIYGTVSNGNTSATAGVQRDDNCFTQYFCDGSGGAASGHQIYSLGGANANPNANRYTDRHPNGHAHGDQLHLPLQQPTPTATPPPTPTPTPTGTPTPTPPPTPTATPSGTPTPTPVPTVPPRPSPGPSGTPRGTPPPRP